MRNSIRNVSSEYARPVLLCVTLVTSAACAASAPPNTSLAEPDQPATQPAAEASASRNPIGEASFTAAQVDFGRETFDLLCDNCHSSSEFRGDNFLYTWRRQTAWDFYRTIATTMPENAPGTLLDDESMGIVAWVLEMNGYEAGDAKLEPRESSLVQFVMDGAPGGGGRTFGHTQP